MQRLVGLGGPQRRVELALRGPIQGIADVWPVHLDDADTVGATEDDSAGLLIIRLLIIRLPIIHRHAVLLDSKPCWRR